jgi:ribosomal protein L40E
MTEQQCAECNCVIPPGATKCPNCDYRSSETSARVPSKQNDNGIIVGRIGNALKCEEHGRIHITASVASVPTRCPFC